LIEKSIHARFRWLESIVQGLSAGERSTVSEALSILTSAAEELEKKADR
jgi:hypothetical protein